jgi:prolyl 4-hydroxylase
MIEEINLGLNEPAFLRGYMLEDLSICDKLIEHFENSPYKKPGTVIKSNRPEIVKDFKDSLDLNLLFHEDITQEYCNQLDSIYSLYTEKFIALTTGAPVRVEAVNVQKYVPGQGFHGWHFERASAVQPSSSRVAVYMTYLNDVTDGGETEFMYQNTKVSPRKGLTLLWPADWTHTHRGITSPSQTKYIITGWFQYY